MTEKIEKIVGEVQDLRKLMMDFQGYKTQVETVVKEMETTLGVLGKKVGEVDIENINNQFMDVRAKVEATEGAIRQHITNEVTEKMDSFGKGMDAVTKSLNSLNEKIQENQKRDDEIQAQVKEALAFKRSLQIFVKSIIGGK